MKELMFQNGEPRDACSHDVLDQPGQANPVCRKCGEVNPDFTDDEEDES